MHFTIGVLVHGAIVLVLIVRVLLRPHREPASRVAWIAVIASVPVAGMIAYLLFGETSIGRRRIDELRRILRGMLPYDASRLEEFKNAVPARRQSLFRVATSISGFEPVGGNTARLMEDSNATIEQMVADIDNADQHVHLLFYIWLADNNGLKVVDAVKRAAQRGVTCRVMADNLGSRAMISSPDWTGMQQAGVKTGVALKIGNPLIRPLIGRIDLRNHRKIAVIDGRVTYCGSQNCADPEFRVKAKYAPWVDCVMRFEGPIALQNQRLFAADWAAATGENIDALLAHAPEPSPGGFYAQAVGTGPTVRYSAMPETFESMFYAARERLIVTTPYYVPDESLERALCSAAYRGVDTTLIVPARNDSWIVACASRSYYEELLSAGVKLFEFNGGLLHAKTLTVDGEVTLIGSANMDRRSFELNYENNILFYDPQLTGQLIERQEQYRANSRQVTLSEVEGWSMPRRLANNALAMVAPIL
ncbi:Cardiolipin synthase [Posidoniimonas corsicana]|uniref:Cardiolipin synthase n=1 Tax=Posidoniimonas corsicana TaxID=1938618 RepID=A0A5C5VB45_9BACT|nr:cardiolipin synthase [Posidoniimonas corsicana]TWT35846.1 Cardiolipin synthase [Posidoniimonas corsicana]